MDGPLSISLIYEMDIHKEFTEWVVARGVKLNGIAAHRFPGRGLGIITEKELKVCRTNLYTAFIHVLFVS
jgi:hypothetical protein